MSAARLAWAAGLFEGEGSLQIFRKKYVRAQLAMTDKDMVERFADIVQVGTVYGPYQYRTNHKPFWTWMCQDALGVVAVIDSFMPWFGERRRAKAVEVREMAMIVGTRKRKLSDTCRSGHLLEGDNMRIDRHENGNVTRRCRVCQKQRMDEWKMRQPA